MGSVTALGIQDTVLDLETQLLYHLKGNHYPPVPAEMVQPCIDAIDAYHDEDYQRMITLPKVNDFQITWRGNAEAPASHIVDAHHLEFWLPHVWDCDCTDCVVSMNEDAGFEEGLGLE
jgi:hypothetical protein